MDSLEEYKLQMDQKHSGEMHYFMLTTIQAATNGFSTANKLGEGGFGPVYRGKLDDGKEIAVKRLSKNSGQGLDEFKTEVRLIVKLQHKNLVRLLDPIKCRELDWPKRANIVDGIAKGLRYLHEDSRLRTIHRDMKSSNVLLDEEMNAKISDFGTARIFGSKYAMEGLFSTKSDVYSFGVMMIEIVTGKRNRGFNGAEHVENLVSYTWRVWKGGKGQPLIDQKLEESCHLSEAFRWINIALLCVQENPTDRPAMSTVVLERTIFHPMETLSSCYITNPKNASYTSQFNKALTTFLDNLRGEAARGDSVHKFNSLLVIQPSLGV
ncbi:hypothetical protein RJ640_005484 [Escallonia rubra]|uniref:non-specific serine/threonine protein kinase n=1 Tax=Escallonia rubra TaxID=112253 RepID=A0AA88RRR7_9ASTE|nr:hypothetical protein RJ640_005484 [Escallonia rubra]